MIYSIRSKHKNKRWIEIKIDLEKACDRVHWDFIKASLRVASFLEFLRKVIMSAIMNTSMQILWNEVPT